MTAKERFEITVDGCIKDRDSFARIDAPPIDALLERVRELARAALVRLLGPGVSAVLITVDTCKWTSSSEGSR